jgi:hypothetical protein
MVNSKEPVAGQQTNTLKTPVKKGRPTIYTAELAGELCSYLAQGMSLRKACAKKGMPGITTVFMWLSLSNGELWRDDFREQYARAKQEAADMMAEEILDIANKPTKGKVVITKTSKDKDGNEVTTTEVREDDMLGHRRLQIDTRKFLMAKMKPKIYGDKMDLTTDGEKIEIGRGMSIEEINAILARAEQERKDEETIQQG